VHPDLSGRPPQEQWSARRAGKRAFDLTVAGLALVPLAPIMLLLAGLVRISSPGPALFRQVRVGQHGRPFRIYKFRTMQVENSDIAHRAYVTRLLTEAEPPDGGRNGVYKLERDPRVTGIGQFLRRTSLDELPQLLNVLRGEMSLVGPRPMLPWECELLPAEQRARLAVPAGMTGLWQVSGRSRLTLRQALELDLEYVRRQSFRLDLAIVIRTAWVLLAPRGGAR
jgi:lipopolysaccharide/colanic/teichoic acid biosynthesis glycosyltransferase